MSESGKGAETGWSNANDKQKMIKELKAENIYEEGMTVDEMKNLLKAMQESMNMSNHGGQNKLVNKSPEVTRQDSQPCNSRVLNSKGSERSSMSPELPTNQLRKNLSQEKRSGDSSDEGMFTLNIRNSFSKENKNVHPANINKSRLSIDENSSEAIDNNKQSVQRANSQMRNHETPKWRMNPLEAPINASDTPLQPRYRTFPEKDCAEVGTSVNIDKALSQLTNHLKRVSELWQCQQQGSPVRAQFPWGKAIQVGTDNGSLDKDPIPDGTPEDAAPSETNVSVDTERRRRNCAKKIDYTVGEGSGSNSEDDFEQASTSKRRKATKRAGSSEKMSLPAGAAGSETTKRRKAVPKKDDVYEWEAIIDEDDTDEELQKSAKKKRVTRRAGSSEKSSLMKETAVSEATRKRKNLTNKEEVYELEEAIEAIEEDNSDAESRKAAKKRKPTKSETTTKKPTSRLVEPVSSNAPEKQDDAPVCLDDFDGIMISDSEESNQSSKKPQRSRSEEAVSSTSSSYPRRIVPPNPKGKFWGVRTRKPLAGFSSQARGTKQSEQDREDDEEVARANRKGKSNSGLQDSEIVEALENIEEDIPTPVDLEIRPLRVSSRMKMQKEYLQSLQRQEEQSELQRAEEQRIKEEQAIRLKNERMKQRLREHNEKIRRDEQIAKAKAQTETRWNSFLNQGKKRQAERTELNPDGPRQNSDVSTVEMFPENSSETEVNDIEMINDNQRSGEQQSKRVPCPICGKKFQARQIEDHAASCEEYDATNSAGASRSNSPVGSTRPSTSVMRRATSKMYECINCCAFSSNVGWEYEDHVITCVAKARDGVPVAPSAVVQVPDSPLRSFRKVSEQADSEINYKGQFVPKTKSHINETRKRKRPQ